MLSWLMSRPDMARRHRSWTRFQKERRGNEGKERGEEEETTEEEKGINSELKKVINRSSKLISWRREGETAKARIRGKERRREIDERVSKLKLISDCIWRRKKGEEDNKRKKRRERGAKGELVTKGRVRERGKTQRGKVNEQRARDRHIFWACFHEVEREKVR